MSNLYKVDRIIGKKNTRGFIEYKVVWEGWSKEEATWEPVKNLRTVQNLIEEFESRNIRKMKKELINPTILKKVV